MILATEEVISAILKVISATTKAIDSPVLLLEANSKYVLNIIIIGIGDNLFYVYFSFSICNKTIIV